MNQHPWVNESICHGVAWNSAHTQLDRIGNRFNEEEQRELFALLYNESRAVIESYCTQSDREAKKIAPSNN